MTETVLDSDFWSQTPYRRDTGAEDPPPPAPEEEDLELLPHAPRVIPEEHPLLASGPVDCKLQYMDVFPVTAISEKCLSTSDGVY